MRLEIILAAAGPARGHFHGLAGALVGGGKLGALVEGHDDVGAEADLGGQRGFRREEMQRAVEVRAELHAILGELAQIAEAEDLEAAGVGEDGLVPGHELLHPAELADGFDAGAEIEMVGVVEQDLNVELFEHVLRHALDRGDGAYRHEDGGSDLAVRSDKAAGAGRAAGGFNLKGKRHGDLIVRQRWPQGSTAEAKAKPFGGPFDFKSKDKCPRRGAGYCP